MVVVFSVDDYIIFHNSVGLTGLRCLPLSAVPPGFIVRNLGKMISIAKRVLKHFFPLEVRDQTAVLDILSVFGSDFDIGNVVRFVCNDDYRLIGPDSRECLSNGYWSGFQPHCERKLVV